MITAKEARELTYQNYRNKLKKDLSAYNYFLYIQTEIKAAAVKGKHSVNLGARPDVRWINAVVDVLRYEGFIVDDEGSSIEVRWV